MVEVGQDSQRAKDWQKVIEQELRTGNVDGVDFRHFFDGFTAATDAPSCVRPSLSAAPSSKSNRDAQDYFEEISKQYPDCKIILTHRDPDAWWHSLVTVLFEPHHLNPWHRAATFWVPPFWHVLKMIDKWHLLMAKRYGKFDKHVMTKRVEEVKAKSADSFTGWEAPKLTIKAIGFRLRDC
jgi:hypothetical protein